jgi:hypothetical protein
VRRLAAAPCLLLSLLLTAACGLPLSSGVQQPGPVPAEVRPGGDIQVLPPAPRDDAQPDEIVRDFFGAQSSPADAHASAREFLAPEVRAAWSDNAPVRVFGSELTVLPVDGNPNTFRVTAGIVAEIAADGSYAPARRNVDFQVQLRRGPHGRPLITKVPNGLLLSMADRERSYRPHSVYFLAPPAPGSAPSHLVPDEVFLPVTADSADALVRRLLAGPSGPLGDSVSTAFPTGTTVRRIRTDAAGVVTVDLSRQVSQTSSLARDQMSAQLVWTLRGDPEFSRLRLLSEGRPLSGSGQAVLRDRSDWLSFDPDGIGASPPLYYISGRRLRQLEPTAAPASAASSREVVDAAAASPRGAGLALVRRVAGGYQLRTGPATGPFVLRSAARSLSSPSWGSGEQGVWFLRNGRVTLALLAGPAVDVPVEDLGGPGPVTAVRVSRDGVRVAMIAGSGTGRRLLVGRVVGRGGALLIVGVRSVAPTVNDVSDLSWDSATSLVVLGRTSGVAAPVRVAVDGSSVALVNRASPEVIQPVTVAAAPGQPLVLGALVAGGAQALFRETGLSYSRERGIVGSQPFYPG